MFSLETVLERMPLCELRPTQMTVGRRMVDQKRRALADLPEARRNARMSASLYPAVKSPEGHYHVIDHHHEALAALDAGADEVNVGVVCDLSALSMDGFWVYLDHRSWVHCYDEHGRREAFDRIPKRFHDLADDPYRSLATSVQHAGAFAKPEEPFFDFLWANHFRVHVDAATLADRYDDAVDEAVRLARSDACAFLPGWVGPGKSR